MDNVAVSVGEKDQAVALILEGFAEEGDAHLAEMGMRGIEILSAAVEDISRGKANVDGRLLPEYCYVDE